MITENTCLILGAGASVDAGFPVGEALRDVICHDLLKWCDSPPQKWDNNSISYALGRIGSFTQRQLKTFASALLKSSPRSTDFFLMSNPQFMDIGKAAISAALTIFEDEQQLLFTREPISGNWPSLLPAGGLYPSRGWYHVLFSELHNGAEANAELFIAGNKLSIVTFNYDRSWEHFLHTRFCSMYGLQQAPHLFTRLPVVHVHGMLGTYFPTGAEEWREYGPGIGNANIAKMAAGLHLTDGEIPESVKEQLKRALGEAERIGFLGFAYGIQNLRKLPLKGAYRKIVLGTTKMEEHDRVRAAKSFAEMNVSVRKGGTPLMCGPSLFWGLSRSVLDLGQGRVAPSE